MLHPVPPFCWFLEKSSDHGSFLYSSSIELALWCPSGPPLHKSGSPMLLLAFATECFLPHQKSHVCPIVHHHRMRLMHSKFPAHLLSAATYPSIDHFLQCSPSQKHRRLCYLYAPKGQVKGLATYSTQGPNLQCPSNRLIWCAQKVSTKPSLKTFFKWLCLKWSRTRLPTALAMSQYFQNILHRLSLAPTTPLDLNAPRVRSHIQWHQIIDQQKRMPLLIVQISTLNPIKYLTTHRPVK